MSGAALRPAATASGHGMGRQPVAPDWAPLTDAEVAGVLRRWGLAGSGASVRWWSPRPFSAAGVVVAGDGGRLFVKRHHRSVRTPAQLLPEHAFADHLRAGGVPVPAVLAAPGGETAVAAGEWTYELHAAAPGLDRYRTALSWTPYRTPADAAAAGSALGRLHRAASDFDHPPRAPGMLLAPPVVAMAPDPREAIAAAVAGRPVVAAWLEGQEWQARVARLLAPWAPVAEAQTWGHGDWHPSNLTWGPTGVAGVLDLGLANRTGAAFDVAVAIERTAIGWLDLAEGRPPAVDYRGLRAFLEGYRRVAPLDDAAVAAALPWAHVDYALAEVDYFLGVVRSAENATLAWDGYLCGHLAWWDGPEGRRLLEEVGKGAVAA